MTLEKLALIPLLVASLNAYGQGSSDAFDPTGANVTWEVGLGAGKILPNQIPGMTEIIGIGGVKGGYRIAEAGFAEVGFATGNGEGTEWKNLHLSARMEVPVENIVGLVFLGGDATYYKGRGMSSKLFGGGHVGGGVQAQLGGSVWFRSNMKFTINPGTSMYIDFGISMRF